MYACKVPAEFGNCAEWVEMNNFIVELSMLTYQQVGEITSWTALLFGTAWMWKHLSLTAKRS